MPGTDAVSEAPDVASVSTKETNPANLSLESLTLVVNAERLKHLEDKISKEFVELKKRQDDVRVIHQLSKSINLATNSKNEFDCSNNEEIKKLLKEAKARGVQLDENKFKYSKDERERLLENIRMTIEDLNVLNDMQLQAIVRLTNARYESYQIARAITKPLHEDKINKARFITPR